MQDFHSTLGEHLEALRTNVAVSITQQQQQLQIMEDQLKNFVESKEEASSIYNIIRYISQGSNAKFIFTYNPLNIC